MPSPPGVEGLWPIIVDSVMIVSVIVSMATSPITGAASLMRMSVRSPNSLPAEDRATCSACTTPYTFCRVPLMPVVGMIELARNAGVAPAMSASATSVVAFPMSIPAISRMVRPLVAHRRLRITRSA